MKNKILIIIILILIFSIILIYFYSKRLSPILLKYAKIESKKIAIDIVSKGVSDEVSKVIDKEDMFIVEKDNNGNIETIDYNSKTVNKVLSTASKKVMSNYNKITSNDNVVTKIPLGVVSNNIFFENLGPKIPVKIVLDGNVLTSLKTDVKNYGVNSGLIIISVKIEAKIDVIIPFKSNEIKVVNEVPISIKITKGNVSSILNTE